MNQEFINNWTCRVCEIKTENRILKERIKELEEDK